MFRVRMSRLRIVMVGLGQNMVVLGRVDMLGKRDPPWCFCEYGSYM